MTVRIVLQARFTSSRLPGKALLQIAGMPMFVLAAKRAMRSGLALVVATSQEASDDAIALACRTAAIPIFRGSLEDVYGRFIGATADLEDDATVIRLTGDNVFPDADFIQNLIDRLAAGSVQYVAPRWPEDGLPYGLSAEAFRLAALRRATPERDDDAEHVTPALRRTAGNPGLAGTDGFAKLRATVDTPDDYSAVTQVFNGVENAVAVGWRELCEGLAKLPVPRVPWRMRNGVFQSRMTLGGAQLGMRYGITNEAGMPSQDDVNRLVHAAIDHGVTHIDTAQLYGESEARIGAALRGGGRARVQVVTKLRPMVAHDSRECEAEVETCVHESIKALGGGCLDALLLHRADMRTATGGAVWNTLLRLRDRGMVRRLGVSVQNRAEFDRMASDPDVQIIQLPFNLLDRRWEHLAPLRSELAIHVRSVFLQGLLADTSSLKWPRVPGVDAASVIAVLQKLAADLDRRNIADLAVAFVRAQGWVDSLVIGVEAPWQLQQNLELFARTPLDDVGVATVRSRLPAFPDRLTDPAQWPMH